MLKLIFVGLLLIGFGGHAQDGNHFLKTCGAAIRSSDGEKLGDIEMMPSIYCISYLSGFMDGMSIQLSATQGKKAVCLPEKGITNDQAVRTFVKHLRDNPQVLHESGRMSFFILLAKAFPCGK